MKTFRQVKDVNRKPLMPKTDNNSSTHKTVLTENFVQKNTNTIRPKRQLVELDSNNDNCDHEELSSESKKSKTDIDDLLSQYNNADTTLNISMQSSSKNCLESPILNKVK